MCCAPKRQRTSGLSSSSGIRSYSRSPSMASIATAAERPFSMLQTWPSICAQRFKILHGRAASLVGSSGLSGFCDGSRLTSAVGWSKQQSARSVASRRAWLGADRLASSFPSTACNRHTLLTPLLCSTPGHYGEHLYKSPALLSRADLGALEFDMNATSMAAKHAYARAWPRSAVFGQ